MGIYHILNRKNGKEYVGSAVDFYARIWLHKKQLRSNCHHSIKLQRAWNKYGESCFIFEMIEKCDSDQLIALEQVWIDKKDAYRNGYNSRPLANSMLGFKHSKETKRKISTVQIGRVSNRKGCKLSDETKDKLRIANLGKKLSAEVIVKMSGRQFSMTEKSKRLISLASGIKNCYSILFTDGIVNNISGFKDYCVVNGIDFKTLHQWSLKNASNNRVHPKFQIKILEIVVLKDLQLS